MPWPAPGEAIEPVYTKASEPGGRPPIELGKMMRIWYPQRWCNLSDPGVGEALYDSVSMRGFTGSVLGEEAVPRETTICKFRHLPDQHALGRKQLFAVNAHLRLYGSKITTGTIVDATIIGDQAGVRVPAGPPPGPRL